MIKRKRRSRRFATVYVETFIQDTLTGRGVQKMKINVASKREGMKIARDQAMNRNSVACVFQGTKLIKCIHPRRRR